MDKAIRKAVNSILAVASRRLYETLGGARSAVEAALSSQDLTANIELQPMYYEQLQEKSFPVDEKTCVRIQIYRYATGRYELTAYMT